MRGSTGETVMQNEEDGLATTACPSATNIVHNVTALAPLCMVEQLAQELGTQRFELFYGDCDVADASTQTPLTISQHVYVIAVWPWDTATRSRGDDGGGASHYLNAHVGDVCRRPVDCEVRRAQRLGLRARGLL